MYIIETSPIIYWFLTRTATPKLRLRIQIQILTYSEPKWADDSGVAALFLTIFYVGWIL